MFNSKILAAFVGGALGASGLVYVAMRPSTPRPPVIVSAQNPEPDSTPVEAAPPTPAPPAAENPSENTQHPASPMAGAPVTVVDHAPSRPSPSAAAPVRTPVRKKPMLVARNSPRPRNDVADDVPPSVRVDTPPPTPPPTETAAPAAPPEQSADRPLQQPAAEQPEENPHPVNEANAAPNRVTLQRGMLITVRLSESLSTDKNRSGDTFFATLDQPLTVGGFVIAERGARAEGKVVELTPGGRVAGGSHLGLVLTHVDTSDGQRVPISTATVQKTGEASHAADAAKVGGGAVLGAVIGAAAGSGRGAAIGAIAGGASGAGVAVATHNRSVNLPTESRIIFRVEAPVTITERVR